MAFHAATIHAYEQVEDLLKFQKDYRKETGTDLPFKGLNIRRPQQFKPSKGGGYDRRKSLSEIVFVRLVSALEVFLIDLVRDAFLSSKVPFMRNDVRLDFTQAELLSTRSTAEIYGKVINKECRKLSSGGFTEIAKYYSRHFGIDLGAYTPGKSKMEEYHDRRNLLVHRLGRTDEQYRRKYNITRPGLTVDVDYLVTCAKDFSEFAKLTSNQMVYALSLLTQESNRKAKVVERRVQFEVQVLGPLSQNFVDSHYEFWSGDEFSQLATILDERKDFGDGRYHITVSGSMENVRNYFRIVRSSQKRKEVKLRMLGEEVLKVHEQNRPKKVFLDEPFINAVRAELPEQPWPKGVHKMVAEKLDVRGRSVSLAIQQLIAAGVFKHQVDGVIIDFE